MTQEGLIDGGSCLVENRQRSDLQVRQGLSTLTAATLTVVTGLGEVLAVIANLDGDPIDTMMSAMATIGDQAGTPAKGSIILKAWKWTDGDATHIAATTPFTPKVAWVAWGFGP